MLSNRLTRLKKALILLISSARRKPPHAGRAYNLRETVSNDGKLKLRHSFMLQQLYQIPY